MSTQETPHRVLHIIVRLAVTNAQYNEHCLPVRNQRDISICSYSRAILTPSSEITVFEGDDTLRGFWRALREALKSGPYDAIHVHAPRTAILLLLMNLLHRRSMSDTVCTIHNSFRSFPLINQLLLFVIFMSFPVVILCSRAALASMPRALRWLGRGKVTVIQNGVDTDRIRRAVDDIESRSSNGLFVAVSIGRLIPRKDPVAVLSAFERGLDADSRLVYVGDGDLREQLLEQIDRRKLGTRITVTGLVDREEVYRYAAQGDVFVSLSHSEGLPVAVLEAMACGIPVILSDIAPHREIIGEGGQVALVPPGNVDRLAEELRRLREMPRRERVALGEWCKQLVEDRFSLGAMHRSYGEIYEGFRVSRDGVAAHLRRET